MNFKLLALPIITLFASIHAMDLPVQDADRQLAELVGQINDLESSVIQYNTLVASVMVGGQGDLQLIPVAQSPFQITDYIPSMNTIITSFSSTVDTLSYGIYSLLGYASTMLDIMEKLTGHMKVANDQLEVIATKAENVQTAVFQQRARFIVNALRLYKATPDVGQERAVRNLIQHLNHPEVMKQVKAALKEDDVQLLIGFVEQDQKHLAIEFKQ